MYKTMSIHSALAQRPTRKFVILTAADTLYPASVFVAPTGATIVGNIYLFETAAQLRTAAATGLRAGTPDQVGVSLTDLGKDLWFGVAGGDSTILHFRSVKWDNGTLSTTGYVIVENNNADSTSGAGALAVNVARV